MVRDQKGQGTLEYAGVIALAAVLVVALLLAGPGLGDAVSSALRKAICTITGGSCGSPDRTASGQPKEPCVVNSSTGGLSFGADVAVVGADLSGNYLTERLSDGTVRVTYSEDRSLSTGVGVGAYGWLKWGDGGVDAGALAEANIGAFLKSGKTWTFDNETDASDFKLWHAAHDAPNTFLPPVADQAWDVGNWLGDRVNDALGQGYDPPDAETTYYEGGFRGDAFAGFAGSGNKASAALLAEDAAGYQVNHRTGEVTLMVRVSAEGSGELSTLLGGVEGSAGGEAMVAVTLDSSHQPKRMTVRGTSVLAGDADALDRAPGLPEALQMLTSTTASGKEPTAHLAQLEASLDLTDPTNRAAFDAFVASSGRALLSNGASRLPNGVQAVAAGSRLYERFRDDGTVTVLQSDRNGREYGGGLTVMVKKAQGGGEASLSFTDTQLQSARYFDNSTGRFKPWTLCVAK